jgi:hypothetical protein
MRAVCPHPARAARMNLYAVRAKSDDWNIMFAILEVERRVTRERMDKMESTDANNKIPDGVPRRTHRSLYTKLGMFVASDHDWDGSWT